MNVRQSMMPNRHTNHRNCSGTQIKSGKFQYLSFVVVFLFLNLLKNKSITKYFNSDLNIINLTSKKLHLMMMIHRHKKKNRNFSVLTEMRWRTEKERLDFNFHYVNLLACANYFLLFMKFLVFFF